MPGNGSERMLTSDTPAHASDAKRGAMYQTMNGSGWFWMSFMMAFWAIVLGAVVYAAVRLAQRPRREAKR